MKLLTLKSILVATDMGDSSRPALRTGAHLARLAGAKLNLLHVSDNSAGDAEVRLREHFRDSVPDAPEPDHAAVIPGTPAAVIVDHAVRVGADTIIVGPHRREDSGGEMGSTAISVVRTAPCACLVAATELKLPLDRILVAIDLSDAAGGALSVGLSWASALRPRGGMAQLTALYVAAEPDASVAEDAVRNEVQQAREGAGGAAQVDIQDMITPGSDPAGEILRQAAAESADLVVMGTRGAARAELGLGSVSAAVSREISCPLLLVPPAVWKDS